MIINAHFHGVNLAQNPKVEAFRQSQIAGQSPRLPELSDTEVTDGLTKISELLTKRGEVAILAPRGKAMATNQGTIESNRIWARANNDLILRGSLLYKGRFAPAGMLPQCATKDRYNQVVENCVNEIEWCAKNNFACVFLDPDGTGAWWSSEPFTHPRNHPIFAAAHKTGIPIVIHGSESTNPNFHYSAAQYITADVVGITQLMQCGKTLFSEFPNLKFMVPHGGGALPMQFGRWTALAKRNGWMTPRELLKGGHLLIDTAVYDFLAMEILIRCVGIDSLLFSSEAHGAFPGIKSDETGQDADNTQLYIKSLIQSLKLNDSDQHKIFEGNARKFFHSLNMWF